MLTINIKGADKLGPYFKQSVKKIVEEMKKGLLVGMQAWSGQTIANQMTGRPGLNVGTGDLRRSWTVRRYDDIVKVSTDSIYAHIHQTGGTISMKNKLLTIPATDEARGHFAKEFDLKFAILGGHKALVERSMALSDTLRGRKRKDLSAVGGRRVAKVFYWLKESVYIPKRLHINESLHADAPQIIRAAISKRLIDMMG